MTDQPNDTSAPDEAAIPNDPFTLEGIIAQEATKPVWYRRGWVLASAAVAVVIIASVLVDLPTHTNPATDASDQTAVMKQINAGIAGCAFGVQETFTIYQSLHDNSLSASDKAETPAMMRDDQSACAFTSSSIYDLSNVEGTGTPAGKNIGNVVNVATLWATSDALAAIEDIQTLTTDPGNAKTLADLGTREIALAKDRTQARDDVLAADRLLNTQLPMPDMPALPHLPGT